MAASDVSEIRRSCEERAIMLCFNGPISRSLIEEVGNALRNYLRAESPMQSAASDVFAVYIEMTQNMRHYAQRKGYSDAEATATVVVARGDDGSYIVSAGNLVEPADGQALVDRVNSLQSMDKAALKAAYKEQLRKPRERSAATGAGLGLIDMARRSRAPLGVSLAEQEDGRIFFTLTAMI
jgi:hypothetical protein